MTKRVGRPPHEPTPATRRTVEIHAAVGTAQEQVAKLIGIDRKTLVKWYREELDLGLAQANAVVASALFTAAKRGNVVAQIFWLKARAGWMETSKLSVGGDKDAPAIGVRPDLSGLTEEERDQLRTMAERLDDQTLEKVMQAKDAADRDAALLAKRRRH